MGPAGLTAVFGMGTGVAPPVWSPGKRPAGGQAAPAASSAMRSVGHAGGQSGRAVGGRGSIHLSATRARRIGRSSSRESVHRPTRRSAASGRGGGSGWSSRSAVRTGRLRRSPAVHSRPIDLVVFQEPSQHIAAGNLVLEGASRLDAFSAYPVPTWLPGDAPSGTAGTPEVGPPQSSRTRGDAPQVSYAHGR